MDGLTFEVTNEVHERIIELAAYDLFKQAFNIDLITEKQLNYLKKKYKIVDNISNQ